MKYRQLGKSSLQISEIGFGCMSLQEDQASTTKILHRAIDLGINFFDTADLYQKGINEEMIGKALKEKRKSILLATKGGNQWRADGSGFDWNPRKEYILAAVEKSLQRLQTDHIDLFQLHGGTISDPIDEMIEALERLLEQGKIRYYGISSIRPAVIREYVQRSNIVSVMMQYSLLDRRPEETCLPLLQKHNIGVLARGALAKGLLAGKPSTGFLNYSKEEVQKAADAVKNMAGTKQTQSQTALRFVLDNPAISSAVTGIRTMEQLEEIATAWKNTALSAAESALLQEVLPVNKYEEHR